MGGYEGNKEDFDRAYSQLTDVQSEMNQNLTTLEGEMSDVLTVWSGAGADAFRTLMQQVDEKGNELNTALGNLTELMQTAGAAYEAQEMESTEGFGGGFPGL